MWRIMIVDDDYIVRQGMGEMLRWSDMLCEVVATADDGVDALRQMPGARPDIVFTDVVMPRMDGLELLRQINLQYPWAKVVVISAYDEAASVRRALRYDAVDYLLKPFDERDVFEALTRVKLRLAREKARPAALSGADGEGAVNGNGATGESDGGEAHMLAAAGALSDADFALAREKVERLIASCGDNFLRAASLCVDLLVRLPGERSDPEADRLTESMLAGLFYVADMDGLREFMRAGLERLCAAAETGGKGARVARTVSAMLRERFRENVTVAQLAESLGMSENHLQATFKRETGVTIRQFLTDVRVERAARLLVDTDEKIFAIATDVGYHDVDHFVRVFRERMNVTPNAYREKYRRI